VDVGAFRCNLKEELKMTFNICGIEFTLTDEGSDALMTPAAAMAAGCCCCSSSSSM
jgi:hypothetical protein